jgi:mannose-6-phosphate isomerase-like protein (cupin superfamily)
LRRLSVTIAAACSARHLPVSGRCMLKGACILASAFSLILLAWGGLCAGAEREDDSTQVEGPVLVVAAPDSVGELQAGEQMKAVPLGTISAMSAALVKLMGVKAHYHAEQAEFVYVLEGSGTLVVGGKRVRAAPGTAAMIPAGTPHSFESNGKDPCLLLSIKVPPADGSDMIYVK